MKAVGMDFGIKNFITLSDGTFIPFPETLKKDKREISKIAKERKIATKKERSVMERKLRKLRKRYNQGTTEFLHETARKLISNYDWFCVEDINKQGMRGPLRATIRSMPWRRFIVLLRTQCTRNNKGITMVPPQNTSRACSQCGHIKERLTLKERTYKCAPCGFQLDRDLNAALNILNRGLDERSTQT